VGQLLQRVFVHSEDRQLAGSVEQSRLESPHFVFADVEFAQTSEFVEVFNLGDIVVAAKQHFEVLQNLSLKSVQKLQIIALHVQKLNPQNPKQTASLVLFLTHRFDK
jgi:hypothetical protein